MIKRLCKIKNSAGQKYAFSLFRIAGIVALLAFVYLTGLTTFHHHDNPKDADTCVICQAICLANTALPVMGIAIVFAVIFFILTQPVYSFIHQSYLSFYSARAPPALTF